MEKLKQIVKIILNVKPHPSKEFEVVSYGQEGEDIILKELLNSKETGFFIDIGAHHPFRFSNTFKFYQKGWRGINIDPIPGIKELFDTHRPEDINLETGINNQKETLTYYNFKEKAFNTFSKIQAEEYLKANWPLESKLEVETSTLNDILSEHLPPSTKIDFMSVDVEGFEMNVLTSFDWEKYKPTVLLIEILDVHSIEEIFDHPLYKYISSKNYVLASKTINTFFFKLE